jgi:hypothetical protein
MSSPHHDHRWLHTQRTAYERMGRVRKVLHRALWALYIPVADHPLPRRLWGLYRRTWP